MPFESKAQRRKFAELLVTGEITPEMTTYIGLLRAINLPAHNKIAMAELKSLLLSLGMHDPKTLLLSGNVVFGSKAQPPARLEGVLEAATARRLGVTTDYFVRTAKEWQALIAANPFPAAAKSDPSHLLVMCLRDAPKPAAVKALQAAIAGRELVKATGPNAYLVYPDGIGRSRLTTALVEKMLQTRGTARNWNTVLKLASIATA